MSVLTEITRIENAKTAIINALTDKGVTVPDDTKIDGVADLIAAITSGGLQATTGSVTPSSTAQSVTVTGLNFEPKFMLLYSTTAATNSSKAMCRIAWGHADTSIYNDTLATVLKNTQIYFDTSGNIQFRGTNVTISQPADGQCKISMTSCNFQSGKAYNWIAFA